MKDVKISNIQLGLLIIGFLYGNVGILNAVFIVRRDAWLATILTLIVGLIMVTVYLHISRLNPGKSLIGILQGCFGKVIGTFIASLYLFTYFHLASMNLRGMGDFMTTVTYPETPLPFILTLMLSVIFYAVKSGIDIIGRISEILVPVILLLILLMTFSMVTVHDFGAFLPFMENGAAAFFKDTAGIITFPYGDLFAFLSIYPYLNDQNSKFKATYIAVISAGILFLIIVVRNIVVLGPNIILNTTFSADVIAKLIPGISIEPLVDIILLITGGLKISVFLYVVAKGVAEIFNIEDYKPLVSAFSLFILVMAQWVFPNTIYEVNYLRGSANVYFVYPLHIAVPLLVLVISLVKRPVVKSNG